MSITVEVDLPDALLKEAQASGLLEPKRLGKLLLEELRREQARARFGQTLQKLHSVPDEPMSLKEIQDEVDAVREERRRRLFDLAPSVVRIRKTW